MHSKQSAFTVPSLWHRHRYRFV